MGMTIDEAIGLLERGSQYNFYDSAEDFCKAYDMAIDTMHKYQKIQEILKDIPYGGEATVRRIQEVIEDGHNN